MLVPRQLAIAVLEIYKSNNIENTYFVKADIFDDVLNEKVFDFVWCNGVLHHTKDPYDAFKIVLKSLKKDGIIVLGLYNRIGRIRTLIRKYLYKKEIINSILLIKNGDLNIFKSPFFYVILS